MKKLFLLATFAAVAALPVELSAASSSSVRGSNHDSSPKSTPPARTNPSPKPAPAPRPAPTPKPGGDRLSRPEPQRGSPTAPIQPYAITQVPDPSDSADQSSDQPDDGTSSSGTQSEETSVVSTQPPQGLTPEIIAKMNEMNAKIEISEEAQARNRQEKKRIAVKKASFTREEAERIQENEMNRRSMDIDQERSQIYAWYDAHRGTRVNALPQGCRRFTIGKSDYFYIEGIFYEPGTTGGYVVVGPPQGAVVDELPPGVESLVVNSPNGFIIYYYANGVFYEQVDSGDYRVVAAPSGVTVASIPVGSTVSVVNGRPYYLFDGNFYEPVMENGVIAYMTVPQPA